MIKATSDPPGDQVSFNMVQANISTRLLLGHSKLGRTVRYPGVEVHDALSI